MRYVITTAWFDHTEPGYWVPIWDDPSPESPPGGLAIVTELLIERHKSPVERHLQAIEAPATDALWLTGTEGVNVEVFDEVGTLKLTHNYFDEEYVRVSRAELAGLLKWRLKQYEDGQVLDSTASIDDYEIELEVFSDNNAGNE